MGTQKKIEVTVLDETTNNRECVSVHAKTMKKAMNAVLGMLDPDFPFRILFVDAVSAAGRRVCVYEN